MAKHFFTSESVTEGHPDKLCDQISDAVLDAIIEQDPDAHVACEVTATTGMVHVMGEISTSCYVDINQTTSVMTMHKVDLTEILVQFLLLLILNLLILHKA